VPGDYAPDRERQVGRSEPRVWRLRSARGFVPDCAWSIVHGAPYRAAWEQYQKNEALHALIADVGTKYATDPNYAHLAATIALQVNVARRLPRRARRWRPLHQRTWPVNAEKKAERHEKCCAVTPRKVVSGVGRSDCEGNETGIRCITQKG
jgi:hypothetical protein